MQGLLLTSYFHSWAPVVLRLGLVPEITEELCPVREAKATPASANQGHAHFRKLRPRPLP